MNPAPTRADSLTRVNAFSPGDHATPWRSGRQQETAGQDVDQLRLSGIGSGPAGAGSADGATTTNDEDHTESPYDPDEDQRLRYERDQGRRNFSDMPYSRFVDGNEGTTSQGDHSHAFGAIQGNVYITTEIGRGRRAHLIQQVSLAYLRNSASAFVVEPRGTAPTVLDELAMLFREQRVVVLAGPPGSGRTELAIRALHEVVAAEKKIATFRLDADPGRLQDMDLGEGDGYVVDIRPAVVRRRLTDVVTAVAGSAQQHQARIVAVVDEAMVGDGWAECPVVHHLMPDRWFVLRRLLLDVHKRPSEEVEGLRGSIAEAIKDSTMAEVAQSAKAVATALEKGEKADAYLRNVIREEVAHRFAHPALPADPEDKAQSITDPAGGEAARTWPERVHAYRRCFMLSAAVFNGLSLQATTAAAAELSNILQIHDPSAPSISNLFDQPVAELLEWLRAGEASAPDVATPRRVEFFNPTVPDVVLEYVWTSHYLANPSISDWLGRLARSHRDGPRRPVEIRLRAAQAVGRLAIYDFVGVMDTVVEEWIRSKTVSGMHATSWAVEMMVGDPRIAPDAWKRVGDWGRRSYQWQRVALAVYASALTPSQTADALDLVRRVAPMSPEPDYAVAAAMRSAVLAGAQDEVLRILGKWLESIEQTRDRARNLRMANEVSVTSSLPGHAARSLILLGAGGEAGTRRQLLDAARADPAIHTTVMTLWRLALTDHAVAQDAADLLESWLRDSETDNALARFCERLLIELVRHPSVRRRLWFHAGIWIPEWYRTYPTAERLLRTALRPGVHPNTRTRHE